MSEFTPNGYFVDKTGKKIEVMDAAARAAATGAMAKAEENAGEITALSRGVEALQGANFVTDSGAVVKVTTDAGASISVEGEAAGEVTLVHQGKNFLRGVTTTVVNNGVTMVPNGDGTYHISGTANNSAGNSSNLSVVSTNAKIYLPAGTYMVSFSIPSGKCGGNVTCKDLGVNFTYSDNKPNGMLTLTEGGLVNATVSVKHGQTVDDDVWIQVERFEGIEEWTEFEKPVRYETVTTLPTTVNALEGTNILYTTTGDVLNIKAPKSEGSKVDEKIAAALAFDVLDYEIPVLKLTGDCTGMTKDDYVALSYEYRDANGNVTNGTMNVKKQGTSSITTGTEIGKDFDTDVGGLFNFTLKFPAAFEAVEGWGLHDKYVFKADPIDHSHLRNVGGAKLWGQVVASRTNVNATLAAAPNKGAIDGFPCAIVLNGKFYAVGMFNIPKDGWMVGMGSGTQEALICAEGSTNCYLNSEVTVGDDGDFALEYVTDEDNADWVQTSLNTMVNACLNTDGTDLDTTVAQYVDWESAIDLMVFIALVGGFDLRQKNYTLATYDGVKWIFGAYDMDSIWGNWWTGREFLPANTTRANFSALVSHRAHRLVLTYKKDELKARYAALREGVLSEVNVETTLLNLATGIPAAVLDANTKRWPKLRSTAVNNLAQILNWYRMRCQIVDKEVEAL